MIDLAVGLALDITSRIEANQHHYMEWSIELKKFYSDCEPEIDSHG